MAPLLQIKRSWLLPQRRNMKRTNHLIAAFLLAGLAFAKHPKVAKDLDDIDPNTTVSVIVQFKQKATEAHHQKVRNKGGNDKGELSAIKGGAYSMPAGKIAELAGDPDVAYISPDRSVSGAMDYTALAVGADVALAYGYDGKNIGVAVIDSGFSTFSDDLNTWTQKAVSYTHLTLPTSDLV